MSPSKRIFDLFWTLPGIVLLLVPGLAIAVAVVIDDGWPPLYAQERVGLHGRSFKLLKFRSMRRTADRTGGHLTVGDDSRVTHVGRVLRLNLEALSIDRAQFIEELKARNIGSSVHFIPIHLHPYYRDKYGYRPSDYPVAYENYQRIISLPMSAKHTDQDIDDVIEAVLEIVKEHKR